MQPQIDPLIKPQKFSHFDLLFWNENIRETEDNLFVKLQESRKNVAKSLNSPDLNSHNSALVELALSYLAFNPVSPGVFPIGWQKKYKKNGGLNYGEQAAKHLRVIKQNILSQPYGEFEHAENTENFNRLALCHLLLYKNKKNNEDAIEAENFFRKILDDAVNSTDHIYLEVAWATRYSRFNRKNPESLQKLQKSLAKINKTTFPRLYWITVYSICELTNRGWNKLEIDELTPPKVNLKELVQLNQSEIIEEDTSFLKKYSVELNIKQLIEDERFDESVEMIDTFIEYLLYFYFGTEFHVEIGDLKRAQAASCLQIGNNTKALASLDGAFEIYGLCFGNGDKRTVEVEGIIEKLLLAPDMEKVRLARSKDVKAGLKLGNFERKEIK